MASFSAEAYLRAFPREEKPSVKPAEVDPEDRMTNDVKEEKSKEEKPQEVKPDGNPGVDESNT